jgi:hypothetical protein
MVILMEPCVTKCALNHEGVCGLRYRDKCRYHRTKEQGPYPTINYDDTILSTYDHILKRAYTDLEELQRLNRLFKGKYKDRVDRCHARISNYEKLHSEAYDEIEKEYLIIRNNNPIIFSEG